MKHLKYFESNNVFYDSSSESEFFKQVKNCLPLSKKEIQSLTDYIELKNSRLSDDEKWSIEEDEMAYYQGSRGDKQISIHKHDEKILIHKIPDEWFIVNYRNSIYNPPNSYTDKSYWKADQIDGLIQLVKGLLI